MITINYYETIRSEWYMERNKMYRFPTIILKDNSNLTHLQLKIDNQPLITFFVLSSMM